MKLDTTTIVFVSACIDIVLVLILFHAWKTRTTYSGFCIWIAGTVCWSAGSILSLLFSSLDPQFVPKVIGNGLIMLHPLLLYEGLRMFHGLRWRWWNTPLNAVLVLAGILGVSYFFYVSDSLRLRATCISVVMAILFCRIAVEPLLVGVIRRFSMQWLLSFSLLPLIFLLVARSLWHFTADSVLTFTGMMTNESLLRWTLFYGIVVEVVIAYCYLSLTADRVEEELRLTQHALEEANNAKSIFLGMVSHEMRTPLATIVGVGDVLVKRLAGYEQDELLALLHHSTSVLRSNIDDLLDLTRIENGMVRLQPSCFNLFELMDELGTVFASLIAAKGLCYRSERGDDLPEIVIGDRQRIYQVLSNLLENAIKSTEYGTVSASVCRRGDEIVFSISDTGCGLSPEQLHTVFDPYVSFSPSGGIGLGLPISQKLTRAMGGTLTVKSMSGKGSCFTVALPCHEAVNGNPDRECVKKKSYVPVEPLKVIAVDDLPENLRLLNLLLADIRVELTMVGSGANVLELLKKNKFDVLLTDIRMTGIDGIALTRMIRKNELESGSGHMRIVALSANACPENRQAALEAGCDSYLARPYDLDMLLRELSLSQSEPGHVSTERDVSLESQLNLLCQDARQRIAGSLKVIEGALVRSDFELVQYEGHRIKGLGMMFELADAERIGAALEQAGKEKKSEVVAELVHILK